MSDADVYRSTPGHVYGVGIRSSRQEGGTPDCACPCHLADRPSGAKGWYCDKCGSFLVTWSWPEVEPVDYSHEQAIADGIANPRPYMVSVPDYYYLTKGNSLDDAFPKRHFKSLEAADKAALELNERDVRESLNLSDTALVRRERLKKLRYWGYYGAGGAVEAQLPANPLRYAVESSWGGDSSWDTVETLEEVGTDAERVYDLDDDREVPFTVGVEFT